MARRVLSEPDPAIDLPEDERWMAGAYGKVREHSAALRQGICETLVILSVHGENLLHPGIGIAAKVRVDNFVRELLTPPEVRRVTAASKRASVLRRSGRRMSFSDCWRRICRALNLPYSIC